MDRVAFLASSSQSEYAKKINPPLDACLPQDRAELRAQSRDLNTENDRNETTLAEPEYDMANRSIEQEDNAAPIIHLKDREEGQHRPYLCYVKCYWPMTSVDCCGSSESVKNCEERWIPRCDRSAVKVGTLDGSVEMRGHELPRSSIAATIQRTAKSR